MHTHLAPLSPSWPLRFSCSCKFLLISLTCSCRCVSGLWCCPSVPLPLGAQPVLVCETEPCAGCPQIDLPGPASPRSSRPVSSSAPPLQCRLGNPHLSSRPEFLRCPPRLAPPQCLCLRPRSFMLSVTGSATLVSVICASSLSLPSFIWSACKSCQHSFKIVPLRPPLPPSSLSACPALDSTSVASGFT